MHPPCRPTGSANPTLAPVVIEAAINGGRTRAEHPAVPLTPPEVAAGLGRRPAITAETRSLHGLPAAPPA